MLKLFLFSVVNEYQVEYSTIVPRRAAPKMLGNFSDFGQLFQFEPTFRILGHNRCIAEFIETSDTTNSSG